MTTSLLSQPLAPADASASDVPHVVFAIGGLYSRSNGIAWIMKDLAAALGRVGTRVDVFAAETPGRESIGELFEPPSRFVAAPGVWLGGLSIAPKLRGKLDAAMETAQVVHNHSLWMWPTHQATQSAKQRNRPVVLTAHGALEPYSLARSRWKKRLVKAAFQSADFRDTDCIQVNSVREGEKVRQAGFRQPLAVIPNGITPADESVDETAFFDSYPQLRGRRLMLFMARLHEKKGLGHFLPAWSDVAAKFPDWHLVIAGPDRGFEPTARELVRSAGLADRVTFTGALHNEMHRSARAASELFVAPSFSEGFSMAVLEAMAAGLPALITPGCNFVEAADAGAACEFPANRVGMVRALEHLLPKSSGDLAAMGQLGRELVARDYNWDRIADQTLDLYRWLIAGGSRSVAPPFVLFDSR